MSEKTYTAKEIEELLSLPCCHTSGMHDPTHYRERRYVCKDQKADALENLCKALGINPITKSCADCGWCHGKDKWCPENRKGEGLHLFEEKNI